MKLWRYTTPGAIGDEAHARLPKMDRLLGWGS